MLISALHRRWRLFSAAVMLIGVPGLLMTTPTLASHDRLYGRVTEIEIDLSGRHAWPMRVRGRAPVAADGTLRWPFSLEGLSSAVPVRLRHRLAGSQSADLIEAPHPVPRRLEDLSPVLEGYAPGDVLQYELTLQIEAAPDGGLEQAILLDSERSGRIAVTLSGRSDAVRERFDGLAIVPSDTPGRLRLEPLEGGVGSNPPGSGARLLLSTHGSYKELGARITAMIQRTENPVTLAAIPPMTQANEAFGASLEKVIEEIRPSDPATRRDGISLGEQIRELAKAGLGKPTNDRSALQRALKARRAFGELGIAADLVLTNRRPIALLPQAPVTLFDTVLLHLPALGRYLDPEFPDKLALDPDLAGHEALLLTMGGVTAVRLPAPSASENRVRVRAEVQVGADGSIEGQSVTEGFGPAAIRLRRTATFLKSPQEHGAIARMLTRQALDGEANLGPSEDRPGHFTQHLAFRMLPAQGTDLVLQLPLASGPRLFHPPLMEFLAALQNSAIEIVRCLPFRLEQEIVFHLPDRRAIVDHPRDVMIKSAFGQYQATYRADGRNLFVQRKLEISLPGPLCSRQMIEELAPLIRLTSRDFGRKLNLRVPGG